MSTGALTKPSSVVPQTRRRLRRRLRTYRKQLVRAEGRFHGRRLHAVRIAGKKLRYSTELCADVLPARSGVTAGELASRLGRLQDLLGDIHDAEVAEPPLVERLAALSADDPLRPGTELVLTDVRSRRSIAVGRLEADWPPPRIRQLLRDYEKVLGP